MPRKPSHAPSTVSRVPKGEFLRLGEVTYRLEVADDHLWYTNAEHAISAWERAAGIHPGVPGVPPPPTPTTTPALWVRMNGKEKQIR